MLVTRLQVRGRWIQQRRWFGVLLQPDIHPFEQVGLVVAGADDVELGAGLVAVRGDELDRAIEGVVAGAAGEGLRFQRRILRPVGRVLVILDQLARAAQQIALEVEGFICAGGRVASHADDDACRVVMLDRVCRAGSIFASDHLRAYRSGRFRAYRRKSLSRTGSIAVCIEWVGAFDEGAHRAVQCVVIDAECMAPTVPGQHRFAGGVVQHPAITGIHAVLEEQIAGDVVAGHETGDRIGRLDCSAPAA